jgi:GGDEF domain-containing protein
MDSLIKKADAAMYIAKRSGGNKAIFSSTTNISDI